MKQFERLFENPFADERITASRLANFAEDCLNRFTKANADGSYATLIGQLTPAITALQNELGNIAGSQAARKGKTLTVQQFVTEFKKTMSEKEGVIADAVGGFNTPAFLEIYPGGVSEYSDVTLAKMPTIVKRLNGVATKYAASLSPNLLSKLQGFEAGWHLVSTDHQQVKASLSSDRTDRTTARSSLEVVLLHAVYQVADRFPGNVAQCLTFFDFNLLEGTKSHKEKTPAEAKGTAVV